MAIVPNPYADETVETIAEQEIEDGNVPLVCPGCNAVTGEDVREFTRVLSDASPQGFGRCDNCGESFVPINENGEELDPAAGWEP